MGDLINTVFFDYAWPTIEVVGLVFIFAIWCGVLWIAAMFVYDVVQTKHTIRRNYPVIGRFRYLFEHIGEFFRQYFFAMDREELPFNRADRSWVYRAAKNVERTIAFGSTRSLTPSGEILFLNSPFPVLDSNAHFHEAVWIGQGYVSNPYKANSVFNISGMSYGALSKPAVQSLAHGAKKAGVWINTGEGAASSYHLLAGCDVIMQIGTAKYGVRDKDGHLSTEKLQRLAKMPQI